MIRLAIATGIPPEAWAAEGYRAIVTAVHLLEEASQEQGRDQVDEPQMSG